MKTTRPQDHKTTGLPDNGPRTTNGTFRFPLSALRLSSAFTLIELLVVIAIIGILAAIVMPSLKSFRPNPAVAATQQLKDDIARARQLAIANHTTVYMVFTPSNFWNDAAALSGNWTGRDWIRGSNLLDKQLIGYNFVSLRSIGDQPGRGQTHYLSAWRTLPDGAYIPLEKFGPHLTTPTLNIYTNDATGNKGLAFQIYGFNTTTNIPFPSEDTLPNTSTGLYANVPFIAFNYLGQLVSGQNELIPVAKGSVLFHRDPNTRIAQKN